MRFHAILSRLLPASAALLVSTSAAAQSWTSSSSSIARNGHGAAALPGGDVLVVGGYTDMTTWTAKAVEGSGLPDEVKRHLASLEDTRVQLVRRHGGSDVRDGRRVFTVDFGDGAPRVGTTMVTDDRELLEPLSTTPYDGLLWLVCTNGRRDVCCAEFGRPVARALAERWPEETWETTHLGGHRFAATFLALPSGITIGRADPDSALAAADEVAAGRHPWRTSRGRAGFPPEAQVAELAALEAGGAEVHWHPPVTDGRVELTVDGDRTAYEVTASPGPERQQSCGDGPAKPTVVYAAREVGRTDS